MPFVDRVNPKELALRSGLSFDKVVEMLDSIASKALIFRLGQSKKRSHLIKLLKCLIQLQVKRLSLG